MTFAPMWVAQPAQAALVVSSIEEKTVKLSGTDTGLDLGDLYYTVNAKNVRTSVIEITRVVIPKSALGRVLKGRTQVGERLVRRPPTTSRRARMEAASADKPASYGEATDQTKWLRLGLGISYFSFAGSGVYADSKSVLGFSIAALGEFSIKRILFESGLLYYQAGTQQDTAGYSTTLTIDYLGVPLVAKWRATESADLSWRLKGGVKLGYALGANYRVTGNGSATSGSLVVSDKIDFLATFGVELLSKLSAAEDYWVELDYDYGLKNYKSSNGASQTSSASNRGWLLLFGMVF